MPRRSERYPAPVDVREWALDGITLTRSSQTRRECVTFQPKLVLGPC